MTIVRAFLCALVLTSGMKADIVHLILSRDRYSGLLR
jgi:hypothetical protein